jgi:hypothetical protein
MIQGNFQKTGKNRISFLPNDLEKELAKRRPAASIFVSEANAVYYISGVTIDHKNDFAALVVVLREPYRGVEQLHIPNVRLCLYGLDQMVFLVSLLRLELIDERLCL